MAAKNRTAELAKLRQVEATERRRAREAELAANTAKRDAEGARGALIEAHAAAADSRALKLAEKAKAEAANCAESVAISAEGAEVRAQRAAKATQTFETEHARELLAELSPAASEVTARLERSARELIAANVKWQAIAQRVGELLVVMPGATPANDAPSTHALESVVRDVRRALDLGAVPSPLPHYRGLQDHEAERERRGHDPS